MQFRVPQFLDIEDKIFGPFTFHQFVYLAGGAGLCFILYKALGLLIGLIPMLAIAGLAAALTFYRPNGKPFINMIEASAKYFSQNKLYIWKKKQIKASHRENQTPGKEMPAQGGVRLNSSKLQDLAWSLDVLDVESSKASNKK